MLPAPVRWWSRRLCAVCVRTRRDSSFCGRRAFGGRAVATGGWCVVAARERAAKARNITTRLELNPRVCGLPARNFVWDIVCGSERVVWERLVPFAGLNALVCVCCGRLSLLLFSYLRRCSDCLRCLRCALDGAYRWRELYAACVCDRLVSTWVCAVVYSWFEAAFRLVFCVL